MALLISHTPILKGEDSKKFNAQVKKNEHIRISQEERSKGVALVKSILKKAKI